MPAPGRARFVAPALVVVLVAFWILLLGQGEGALFGRVPVLDEVWYLDRAAELDGLAAPADRAHFMSPLYPVLIKLSGSARPVPADSVVPADHLRGIRLLQIACWFGVVGLLRRLAAGLLPEGVPARPWLVWLPSLLFAFYRPAAVYALSVLLELPLTLLVLGAVAGLVALPGTRRPLAVACCVGLALGLAGLLRGTALALLAPAVFAAWRTAPRRLPATGLLLAGALLVLLPSSFHNSRLSGRPVGPTLNAGVNLYVGNGPQARGFYSAVIDGDWRHDPAGRAHLARSLAIPLPSLAEADRIWGGLAVAAMREDPPRTAGLWLRKAWLHLQAWEIDQLTPLAGWTREAPLLRVMVVPWFLMVVLAAAAVPGARRGTCLLLLAMVLTLIAAQSLFFVVSRYRLVLVPLLLLLAVRGVAALWLRERAAVLAAALAVVLVVPWGLGGVRGHWQAMALANEAHRRAELGVAAADARQIERAEAQFRAALAAGADGPAPWLGLAALLEARGAADEAHAVLVEGLDRVHRREGLLQAAAANRLAADDPAAARDHLEALLALAPHDTDARHNLVVLLARVGEGAAAEAQARRLVADHPADPRGWNDLAIILARSGRREEAVQVLREGLVLNPGDGALQSNLDTLLAPR